MTIHELEQKNKYLQKKLKELEETITKKRYDKMVLEVKVYQDNITRDILSVQPMGADLFKFTQQLYLNEWNS